MTKTKWPVWFAPQSLCFLMAALVLAAGVFSTRAAAVDVAAPPTGFWYTEGRDGGVELYACKGDAQDEICGRFYWFSDKEPLSHDENNPDPAKRGRPLCQMQFMGGFRPDGEGHYANGWIYSPEHGETFRANITLVDEDTLDLHGYVLTPVLGESQTWKRAKSMPRCRVK